MSTTYTYLFQQTQRLERTSWKIILFHYRDIKLLHRPWNNALPFHFAQGDSGTQSRTKEKK